MILIINLVPVALLLFRGRSRLQQGPFAMGPILGTICNSVGLIFVVFTTVFFLFPPDQPVSGNNMNYASGAIIICPIFLIFKADAPSIVVFAIVIIMATITWFTNARRDYESPEAAGEIATLGQNNGNRVQGNSDLSEAQTEKASDEAKTKGAPETYVVEAKSI